jgi:hypothetical protein
LDSLSDVLLPLLRHIWAALTGRPQVTGDIKRLKAKWWPDYFSLDAEHSSSGIKIRIAGRFTLANNGRVDTVIKDVYMEIIHGRKNLYRLECFSPSIERIRMGPRDVWRSGSVEFDGFIPGIDEPPKSLKCKFVVEAAGQRPFRKNLKLPAIVRMTK